MVLYLTSILKYSVVTIDEVSDYYLEIPKVVFTKTYPVNPQITISAEIEDIMTVERYYQRVIIVDSEWEALIKELKTTMDFHYIRIPLGEYDRLYLYEYYWKRIRDFGILPDEYVIKIKVSYVHTIEGYIELFPRRDMYFGVR